ncbi:MAG: acyltransferase [Mangrovicoccus sp.]|nr:acyltransferase [Mangrovicoccus sp.]
MVFLADKAQGRDNNLNLLRMIAAMAVIVSHAWTFAYGRGISEPLKDLTGHTLGSYAVAVFFAISGFLITGSFQYSSSHRRFLLSRALRLFPALLVNLLFVAFLLGPLVTTLPWGAYFSMAEPYLFVIRNLTLVKLEFHLPGVFETNPYTAVVGSIWTLIYEVLCYCGVFVLGLIGVYKNRWLATGCLLGAFVLWSVLKETGLPVPFHEKVVLGLALPFAIGSCFFVWRERIPLSLGLVAALFALAVLCFDTLAFYPLLMLAISYASFWVGYMPGGWLLNYNKLGDYSYGVYIYGFPMQGLAMWLFGPQTPWENILYSVPMTMVLSVISWHYIEKPALDLKPSRKPKAGAAAAEALSARSGQSPQSGSARHNKG